MRRFTSGLIVVLATVLLVVSTFGWWANRNLLNSQRFATGTTKVLQESSVQDALTATITNEISRSAGRDVRLAEPIIAAVVRGIVTSDAFQHVFATALTHVHEAVVNGGAKEAVIDLSHTVDDVRLALKQIAPGLAEKIPSGRKIEVKVLDRTQLGLVDRITSLTHTVTVLVTVVTFALLALALAISPRRWRTLAFVGWSMLVGFAILLVVQVTIRIAIGIAIHTQVNASAAQDVYQVMTRGLVGAAIALGVVGLLIGLLGGWIDRHGGWSAFTRALGSGVRWLRSHAARTDSGGGPVSTPAAATAAVATAATGASPTTPLPVPVPASAGVAVGALAPRLPAPARRARSTHWWRAAGLLVVGLYAVVSPSALVSLVVVLAGIALLWLSLTEALAAWAAPREPDRVGPADHPPTAPPPAD
ncbi:MAG: hypothetical protein WCI50_10310 [Actinomycetes bacterium]